MRNEVVRLTNPLEVTEYWHFFLEGMTMLNDPRGAKATYTNESFFTLICKIIGMGEKGLVFLLTSKNAKLLGFGIAFEAIDFSGDKCMFLVELYSNSKCATAAKECIAHTEQVGRKLGLKQLKSASRRFNGGALRLFEERWGFTREYQTFTKEI